MSYSSSGPRRLPRGKIKPPKLHQPEPDIWPKLSQAISEIQNSRKVRYEVVYHYAYQLIIHKRGQELYNGVTQLIVEHLENRVKDNIAPHFPQNSSSAASIASVQANEQIISSIRDEWQDHTACMLKIRDVLQYMDKVYVKPPILPAFTLGISLFLSTVIQNPSYPVKEHLISALLNLIRLERQGEAINQSAIYSCTSMLKVLQANEDSPTAYHLFFEDRFIAETKQFYTLEADELLSTLNGAEYIRKIDRRFKEEDSRLNHYLLATTEPLLTSLLEQIFIAKQIRAVLDHPRRGFAEMMNEGCIEELGLLYQLFSKVEPAMRELRAAVRKWIINAGSNMLVVIGEQQQPQKGTSIPTSADNGVTSTPSKTSPINNESNQEKSKKTPSSSIPSQATIATLHAIEWASRMIELKAGIDKVYKIAFTSDKSMQAVILDALSFVVNQSTRAAEFISLYLDDHLRKGFKGSDEAEIEQTISQAIVLFGLISDKDVFERYYKTHLAKRLLQGRAISEDLERSILGKLKIESGASFVRDLEGMLRDVKLSQEMSVAYKAWLKKQDEGNSRQSVPSFEISPQICTSSFWPLSSSSSSSSQQKTAASATTNDNTNNNTSQETKNNSYKTSKNSRLPPDFVKVAESFERFYLSRHTGRKLTWHPDYGSVDVRIHFKARQHEVNLSTLGMIVLNCFEHVAEGEILTYEELAETTGMSENDLNRTLQSLACAKYRVLIKVPKGRDINKSDVFEFNHGFSCPLAKIKIQTIANKVESNSERETSNRRTEEERKFLMEACVVRIMKNRKNMQHIELVNEVIGQLAQRFRPNPANIKMAIDRLIEKEYLERDDKDRKLLRYLA